MYSVVTSIGHEKQEKRRGCNCGKSAKKPKIAKNAVNRIKPQIAKIAEKCMSDVSHAYRNALKTYDEDHS